MSSRNTVIGVAIIAVIMAVLAVLAFTQQQQAANQAATAVANAEAANTSAAEANAARETAVAQANAQATAQTNAEAAQADAEADQAAAEEAQAAAEAAQADAESTRTAAEAAATEQADAAAAAQAEATEQAAAAAAAQGEAEQQQATAQALESELTEESQNRADVEATATSAAATAVAQQEQAAADAAAAQSDREESEAGLQATIVALQDELEVVQAAAASAAEEAANTIADLQEQLDNVPEVVIEPTPVPTDEEEEGGDNDPFGGITPDDPEEPELTGTYTTEDGNFTISHPRGWLAFEGDEGQIYLVSSEAAAQDVIPAGEMYIIINPLITDESQNGLDPVAAVTAYTDIVRENNSSLRFSLPEAFRLGSYNAARTFSATEGYDLEIIIFGVNDAIMIFSGYCSPGEGEDCEPILTAIAKSLIYN